MQGYQEESGNDKNNRSQAIFIPAGIINGFSKRTIGKGEKYIAQYKCCKYNGSCFFKTGAAFHKIII